jgi:hypothetical protein
MSNSIMPQIVYDTEFLIQLRATTIQAGHHKNLIKAIGEEELLNHLSTIFWAPKGLLGLDVTLTPGVASPIVQAAMQAIGLSQLIGFTPLYPRSNPFSGDWDYVTRCEAMLDELELRYLPAKGRALDFSGGDGCFILVGVGIPEAMPVLFDQLSCIVLPVTGVAKLVSLVD